MSRKSQPRELDKMGYKMDKRSLHIKAINNGMTGNRGCLTLGRKSDTRGSKKGNTKPRGFSNRRESSRR